MAPEVEGYEPPAHAIVVIELVREQIITVEEARKILRIDELIAYIESKKGQSVVTGASPLKFDA